MKNNKLKTIGCLACIISGIISIVFSAIVKGMFGGGYVRLKTYGSDFYTGIQNAAVACANNVVDLRDAFTTGVFAVLLVLGIALIGFALIQLSSIKKVIQQD